ncbi:MAG: hypothetical protein J6Z08_09035 [Elusimicrobiales bacterium]|nr:hypothetical protein [Elusimicrobiales bacterium]
MLVLVILGIVFLLTAVRRIGRVSMPVWAVMTGGAAASILCGGISLPAAFRAVDFEVIIFLFGMFCAGQVLELSGWLARAQYRIFRRARTKETLLISLVFFMGMASAVFMNDTIAVIGTPVALLMARKYGIKAKELMLALAFAVTVGSAASPIGNPQNLLVAVKSGMTSPFADFISYLFIPTLINLSLVCVVIKIFYPGDFTRCPIRHHPERVKDPHLAMIAKITIGTVLAAILVKIVCVSVFPSFDFSLVWIAVAAALPGLLLSPRRFEIIKSVDWRTLAFFVGMFVLMQAVWNTGFFQKLIAGSNIDISSVKTITAISVIVSQFVSNVPLTALYIPLLKEAGAGVTSYVALAASATVAGNLFILGAASNIIIVQAAERRGEGSISVWEFTKVGLPLTIANSLVYLYFLTV